MYTSIGLAGFRNVLSALLCIVILDNIHLAILFDVWSFQSARYHRAGLFNLVVPIGGHSIFYFF